MRPMPSAITKILSANDTGETNAHQAGILIPKKGGVLEFFPELDAKEKNPRVAMYFEDESGQIWKFMFIYYNNKLTRPNGTRNEYRLTGMTGYIRQNDLKEGDEITLTHEEFGRNYITCRKKNETKVAEEDDVVFITIGKGWKIIDV